MEGIMKIEMKYGNKIKRLNQAVKPILRKIDPNIRAEITKALTGGWFICTLYYLSCNEDNGESKFYIDSTTFTSNVRKLRTELKYKYRLKYVNFEE